MIIVSIGMIVEYIGRADVNGYGVRAVGGDGQCSGFVYQFNGMQFCSGIAAAQNGTIFNTF